MVLNVVLNHKKENINQSNFLLKIAVNAIPMSCSKRAGWWRLSKTISTSFGGRDIFKDIG